jgi:hypothetical protein
LLSEGNESPASKRSDKLKSEEEESALVFEEETAGPSDHKFTLK